MSQTSGISARSTQARYKTLTNGIEAADEQNRNRRGGFPCCLGSNRPSAGHDQGHLALNQLARQSGKLLVLAKGPAILDLDVWAFEIAKLIQPPMKARQQLAIGRLAAEIANHRDGLRRRSRKERRNRRRADQHR